MQPVLLTGKIHPAGDTHVKLTQQSHDYYLPLALEKPYRGLTCPLHWALSSPLGGVCV